MLQAMAAGGDKRYMTQADDRRVKVASTRPEEYDAADAAWMLGLYDVGVDQDGNPLKMPQRLLDAEQEALRLNSA